MLFSVRDGYLIYPFGMQAFVRLQVTVMASQTVMKQMSTVVARSQPGSAMQEKFAKSAIVAPQYARHWHDTGTMRRVCHKDICPLRHPTNRPLALVVQMDAGFEDATVSWSSRAADLSSILTNSTQLIIPSRLLPLVGEVEITTHFTLNGRSGSATMVVPVDGAPYCLGTCMSTTATSDTFPKAAYTATVSGIVDDGPLM